MVPSKSNVFVGLCTTYHRRSFLFILKQNFECLFKLKLLEGILNVKSNTPMYRICLAFETFLLNKNMLM